MLAVPERFRPVRADWMQAGIVAAVLFALYALTAPRTVAMEDDGLFVLSSYFLGIEHPPGYPLFTLIGHLFTQLPFGSVAYRVHLVSAFFGALTGAAVWLCARSLIPARLPAYVAAFGLGVSPVFWSQSIIAEVYTLNTFLFLLLVFLGLQACPPSGQGVADPGHRRILPWMAFLFGLSLSNHYPLMLLVSPALVILLWPMRDELLKRIGLLTCLVVLGLLPYAWLVHRSWMALPVSFYGPLESLPEIWFFVSRAGYSEVDHSTTADFLDRIRFFQFQAGQLLLQFAIAGTILAAAGFAVQWRILGRRMATFFTLAFLMPSAVLLLLLGFDYDSLRKHIYHVYPLPAYAVGALWMGLGFAWLAERYAPRRVHAAVGGVLLIAAILAVGARFNLFEDHEWGARYAQTILKTLPQNAVVFGRGDSDLVPMAYFHMVENLRPDITLYNAKGLVLGNRLFHPLRTDEKAAERIVREMIDQQTDPVVFTLEPYASHARRDRWLYSEIDKSSSDPKKLSVDIPDEAVQFFEGSVAQASVSNAWVAFVQGELRRRYAVLLAQSLPRNAPLDPRARRQLDLLAKDFHGALGITEGLMLNRAGYSTADVANQLDRVRDLMPSDVPKEHLSRFFYLRGAARANLRDGPGGIEDLETALSLWSAPDNPAIHALTEIYKEAGDSTALEALQGRVKRLKAPRR